MKRRTFLKVPTAGFGACALLGLPAIARAQAADATCRVLVGFPAGGTGDFVARAVAEQLRLRSFAPAVIVENRPGAGGILAIQALKAAAPDGLTLLNTPASVLTILPHAHRRPPFDTFNDLTPIATVSDLDFAIVAGANTPARTLPELMALARRDPKFAIYGTAGVGTMSHVLGAMLARRAGVELVHAPYKGGGAALQDAIGGQVPIAILSLSETMLRAHQDGRLRVLATSGAKRSRFLHDVPTVEEAGFKGVVASDWNTVVAPPKMPQAVVERLSRTIGDITADPKFAAALAKFFLEPLRLDHAQFAARLKAEYDAMARLVKDERITVES